MTTYQLTGEGYVIRDEETKVPISDYPLHPNTNPDFIAYKAWLAAGGVPLPVDNTTDELAEVRKKAFDELREVRAPMLNAVTGITADALADGNDPLVQEGQTIRQKLLDVTADPLLLAATTYNEMKMAGQLAYRKIAKSASPQFAAVFKETTGA